MKRIVLCLLAIAIAMPAAGSAQVRVRGYTRSDGTYVAPHYRSSPNGTTSDNYSTRGNINPYTGQVGTRDPNARAPSPYAAPRTTPCYYNCRR
jgi:opacity protein-like surface antigen